jgi:hypothetical protein
MQGQQVRQTKSCGGVIAREWRVPPGRWERLCFVAESVRSRGPSQEPAFDQHPQPSDDRHKVHQEPPARFIAVMPPLDLNGNRDPDQRRSEQQEKEHRRTRRPEDCVNHAESEVDEDRCNPPRHTLLPATKAEQQMSHGHFGPRVGASVLAPQQANKPSRSPVRRHRDISSAVVYSSNESLIPSREEK